MADPELNGLEETIFFQIHATVDPWNKERLIDEVKQLDRLFDVGLLKIITVHRDFVSLAVLVDDLIGHFNIGVSVVATVTGGCLSPYLDRISNLLLTWLDAEAANLDFGHHFPIPLGHTEVVKGIEFLAGFVEMLVLHQLLTLTPQPFTLAAIEFHYASAIFFNVEALDARHVACDVLFADGRCP